MKRVRHAIPVAIWIAGVLLSFHGMLSSGFRFYPGNLKESRQVYGRYEHAYQYFRSSQADSSIWDPPFFFPHRNTLAYSDANLTIAPVYGVFRLGGIAPASSFQLLMILIATLNFLAAILLFTRCFSLDLTAASLGAFFLAFGSHTMANAPFPHLAPQFFMLLAVGAIFMILIPSRQSYAFGLHRFIQIRTTWIYMFGAAFVAQAYQAIYPFFFLLFCTALAFCCSLAIPHWRRTLFGVIKQSWMHLLVCMTLSLVAALPFLSHYLDAASENGIRSWSEVFGNQYYWNDWYSTGETSWLYGTLLHPVAHPYGMGLITSIAAMLGLLRGCRQSSVQLLSLVAAGTLLFATRWDGYTLWYYVYHYFPGAKAIRYTGRAGMIIPLMASIGMAFLFRQLLQRKLYWLIAVVFLSCAIEQGHSPELVDRRDNEQRIAKIGTLIPDGSPAFYLAESCGVTKPKYVNLDATWVSLRTGIPTVNGDAGAIPPNYPIARLQSGNDLEIEQAVRNWMQIHGNQTHDVAVIRLTCEPPY